MNVSSHVAIFPWRPACWLRVTGEDAATFLQGQFTNDLRGVAPGGAVYGLWLSLKGKVLADSFIVREREPGELAIVSYRSPASLIRERLESYVIADDVSFTDETADWAGLTIFGPEATEIVRQLKAELGLEQSFIFPGRRGTGPHVEWMLKTADAEKVHPQLAGARQLTSEDVERGRIDAAIPSVPMDIGPADLPNEGGLERDTISYTKGCYLGQEVMARLKSMGQVRRKLLRVRGKAAMPAILPAPLFAGSRQVGELRSAMPTADGGLIGLAMVSLLHVTTQTELAFAADGAPQLRLVDVA